MGAAASITKNEAESYPQYQILGGSARFAELKDEEGNISLDKIEDPYLKYGGCYTDDKKNTIGFKYVAFADFPSLTSEHKSVLATVLTKEVFDELKDVKTSKDITLSNIIQGGVIVPSTKIGLSVGDEESYTTFSKLLSPAINLVHNVDSSRISSTREILKDVLVAEESVSQLKDFITQLKIVAHRNVSGFSFPCATTAEEREAIDESVSSFAQTSNVKGRYINLITLTDEDSKMFIDNGMLMSAPSAGDYLTATGAARSWPKARSIFVSDESDASIWINYEDHIKLSVTRSDLDFSGLLERFSGIHSELESHIQKQGQSFSWSSSLGYLNSSIQNLGIASTISVVGKFPNLSNSDLISALSTSLGLSIEKKGETIEISTKKVFGVSESLLVASLVESLLKFVSFEQLLQNGGTVDDIQKLLGEKQDVVAPEVEEPSRPASSETEPVLEAAVDKARDAEPEKITIDTTSPKAVSAAPGSPKKTPVAKSSFIPPKSPSSKAATVDVVVESEDKSNESQETCSELKPAAEKVAPKKYISAGFMSGKFNNKLTIEIDELKLPEH
jgi:protein-arginine kinase